MSNISKTLYKKYKPLNIEEKDNDDSKEYNNIRSRFLSILLWLLLLLLLIGAIILSSSALAISIKNGNNNAGVNNTCNNTCVNGSSPNVSVGFTFTGDPGTDASVVDVGTTNNLILEFTIPRGEDGLNGNCTGFCVNGTNGSNGTDGVSPTITIGNTTTTSPGTNATVTNAGTPTNVILNFTIPDGATGSTGQPGTNGTNGTDGVSPTIIIGNTTTTSPGTNATVTNAGTPTNVILNFTIPTGATGSTGSIGPPGTNGTNGVCNCTAGGSILFSVDNTTQTVSAANVLTNVTFNRNIYTTGWTHTVSSTIFTSTTTGNFQFYTDILCGATGGSSTFLTVLLKNGVIIDGSAQVSPIMSSSILQHVNSHFITNVVVNDIFIFQMASSRATGQISSLNLASILTTVYSAKIYAIQIN